MKNNNVENETIFHKIIKRELPATILFEDEKTIAFLDIAPISKGHFLVIPKNFSRNLITINDDDFANLMIITKKLANKYKKENGATGYQLHINNEPDAKQVVFYTHVHIIFSYKNQKLKDHLEHFKGNVKGLIKK